MEEEVNVSCPSQLDCALSLSNNLTKRKTAKTITHTEDCVFKVSAKANSL